MSEEMSRAEMLKTLSEMQAYHGNSRFGMALSMAIAALSAEPMRWHYDDFPPSDLEKRYVVVRTNELFVKPILDTADYYTGDGVYSEKPWHLDGGYSCYPSEILAWADVGEIGEIIKHIGGTE